MISVCKMFEFSAAHRLPQHDGLCKNLHGHTYKLEVEITGEIDAFIGMVADFGDMKEIVTNQIIAQFDHTLLNHKFENPTAEIMVERIAELLEISFEPCVLIRVRLWETPTSYAEWRLS